MTTAARVRREERAEESFRLAEEAIGALDPGMALFGITRGQWSMIDAIRACLAQTGPAHLSLWTWRVGGYELDLIDAWRRRGTILGAKLVVDRSAVSAGTVSRGSNAPQIAEWTERFGAQSIRYVRLHAKMVRIWNERWHLLLRGSMNLNENPRFEQFDLSEGGPAFDLFTRIEDELPILSLPLDNRAVDRATKLDGAWDTAQLRPFGGANQWRP